MTESITAFLHATAPHLATQLTEERLALMRQIAEITTQRAELLEALKLIAEGRGPFSRDNLQFACNVIEESKAIASAAIAKAEGHV